MENNQISVDGNLKSIKPNNTEIDPKRKIFRWAALTWPIIGIILVIFYLTDISLYVFWHPVLTVLFKIIYFPFFIFSEEMMGKLFLTSHGYLPNLPNIGIAIIISLGWLFILNRVVIYWVEKYIIKRVILISNILIMVILLFFSFILTNYQVNKCILRKERVVNSVINDYRGVISLDFKSNFKNNPIKFPKLFNFSNDIDNNLYYNFSANNISLIEAPYDKFSVNEYWIKAKNNKENQTICKLELHPRIYFAHPVSLARYIINSDWERAKDVVYAVCKSDGYKLEDTKKCVESILKESESVKNLDYKVYENGKVNVDIIYEKIKDNYPNEYSDDFISFELDGSKFKFLDLGKTGLSFEDVELGNYIQMYRINKFFGYEIIGSLNTLEPYMNIHIPNVSDYPFDGIYDEMDLMSGQIASETKIKLGGYDYLMKNFTESGVEKVVYYTQVNGRKIRIALGMSQYFVKYPELQKEFEEIISTINYNF